MRPRFDIPLPHSDSLELIEAVGGGPSQTISTCTVSGQYAFTGRPTTRYPDLQEVVERIYTAFGAHRMLNASDWPWIKVQPGYAEVAVPR